MIKARKGSGQICTVELSVPPGSLDFWERHLRAHGFQTQTQERVGERLLAFQHPCGIEYELVATGNDRREPYSTGVVPQEYGIRGTHGTAVSVRDGENSDEFMQLGWNGRKRWTERNYVRYEVGAGGSGAIVDFRIEPNVPAGSCMSAPRAPRPPLRRASVTG